MASDNIEEQFLKTKAMAEQYGAVMGPGPVQESPTARIPDRLQEHFDVTQQIAADYSAIGKPWPPRKEER